MKKAAKIDIDTLEEVASQFVATWRSAERNEAAEQRDVRISFEDMATLLKVLTPQRWRLLGALRRSGPSSIMALARVLSRNYRNVHGDVQRLLGIGLVVRDAAGLVSVPFDTIETVMRLDAA